MGSKLWNTFKNEISLIAVFLFLYQLILLPRAVLFGVTWGMPGIIFGIALLFAGYIIAKLITRSKQNFYRILASYLSAIAISIIIAIIYWKVAPGPRFLPTRINSNLNFKTIEILNIIFEGLGIFILYFAGIRARLISYESILSRKKLIFGICVFIFTAIFTHYNKEVEYLKSTVYAFAYIFIILSLLIRNQENLDNAFIKKHIELSTVPKNIRNYNSIIVIILFLLIIIIFNIDKLTDFIVNIVNNLPRTIVLIFIKVLELLSRLLPGEEGQGGAQGGSEGLADLPQGEESHIAGLLVKIFFAIILIAAGAFIIWKLPALLRALGRKLKKVGTYIAEFFRKLFVIQKEDPEKETDYIDEVITVKPVAHGKEEKGNERKIQRIGGRLWKSSDYTKRIRFMYKLIVTHIEKYGINIEKSDTTGEIYLKASEVDGIRESLEYATDVYDKIRYGEKVPDETEYNKFEEKFTHTVDILKKK